MYILMTHCGHCNKPVSQFNICNELGHNPGVDGHLFRTIKEAKKAMSLYDKKIGRAHV